MKKVSVRDVIDAAGGPPAVKRRFGLAYQSVHGWIERNRVPPARVQALAEMTDGKYTAAQIAPEVFGGES